MQMSLETYAKRIKHTADVVWQVREATGEAFGDGENVARRFEYLAEEAREHFIVVTLNQKNQPIDTYTVSIGTLTASLVHPREVFKAAILDSAAGVMFVHNHPSGDPTPSGQDITLTKRLVEAGELLGIRILDHVVIGRDSKYTSFVEHGLI